LESASPTSVHQWQRHVTATTYGPKAGPIVLLRDGCSSSFVLFQRIQPQHGIWCSSFPKCPCPGGSRRGHAWRLMFVGVKLVLDCICAIAFRVFHVKRKTSFYFLRFMRSFLSLYTPCQYNADSMIFGSFHVQKKYLNSNIWSFQVWDFRKLYRSKIK
jgi:hypothetical protein